MHNETKVNTKKTEATLQEAKNNIFARKHAGVIDTLFGAQLINSGDAIDHAAMCSGQLKALLMMLSGTGLNRFLNLAPGSQENLMWLAQQLADQVDEMINIIDADARGVAV